MRTEAIVQKNSRFRIARDGAPTFNRKARSIPPALNWGLAFALLTLSAAAASAQPAAGDTAAAPPAATPPPASPVPSDKNAPISVSSEIVTGSTSTPADLAQEQLNQIDGATSLVTADAYKSGAVSNASDLLKGVPGVIAQSASGTGAALNLSIRGSGVFTGGPFGNQPKGVDLLVNGLPLTSPAAYPFEAVEPLFYNYAEVLRGGAASTFGALRLGGGINFESTTGSEAPGFETRNEFGSYGYREDEIAAGQAAGNWDYYASYVNDYTDGFRENSTSLANLAYLNAGYKFNQNLSTRFSFFYAEQFARNPQQLTLAQVDSDPTQVNQATVEPIHLWQRAPGTYLAQDQTKYQIDPDSSLSLSLQFKHQSAEFLYLLSSPANNNASQKDETGDFASALEYDRKGRVLGLEGITKISFDTQTILYGGREIIGEAPSAFNDEILTRQHLRGGNLVLSVNQDLELVPNLWISPGLSLLQANRGATLYYPDSDETSQSFTNYAPRFGVRYDIRPDAQIFADVTRTVEYPQSTSYTAGLPTVANAFSPTIPALEKAGYHPQTATTAEVGVKGTAGIFTGSVDYYYSWVRNEILTQETAPGSGVYQTSNATPTVHDGIEFGANANLWQGSLAGEAAAGGSRSSPGRLVLNNTLTWSDNHFVNDPAFHRNQIPAIPPVSTYSELLWQDASGLYFGPNLTWVPYKYAADYANTIFAQRYSLFGAKIGYKHPDGRWQVYLDLRNITNQYYVSVINATSNAHGVDAAVYWPGEVFNITGGFELKF